MRNLPTILLLLGALLLIGGLPCGLIGAIFFGELAGQTLFLLAGLLVASFIPLKLLIDRQVKGTTGVRLPLDKIAPAALLLSGFVFIVLVPFLWWTVAPALIAGLAVFFVTQSLPLTLLAGLGVQVISLINLARREKALGSTSSIFGQMAQMQQNFNMETVIITQDGIYRSSSDVDDAADSVQDAAPRYIEAESSVPDTITIIDDRDDRDDEDDDNRKQAGQDQ